MAQSFVSAFSVTSSAGSSPLMSPQVSATASKSATPGVIAISATSGSAAEQVKHLVCNWDETCPCKLAIYNNAHSAKSAHAVQHYAHDLCVRHKCKLHLSSTSMQDLRISSIRSRPSSAAEHGTAAALVSAAAAAATPGTATTPDNTTPGTAQVTCELTTHLTRRRPKRAACSC